METQDEIAGLMRQAIDRGAEAAVFTEVLAEVLSELRSQNKEQVLTALRERIARRQEVYLLEIEKANPGLAARIDKTRATGL